MKPELHRFHGGLALDGHKAASLRQALQQAPLPERVYLPLKQHIGDGNLPVVAVGERVLRGQAIATSDGHISATVHASTSGVVREIAKYPVPHPSGQTDDCIVIDVDGEDAAVETEIAKPASLSPRQILEQIQRAGIAGLGGAAFPTAAKLARGASQGIETLIVNGVECEPYITCDDILMRHYPDELLRGVGYLQQMLAPRETLICIEDNKPEAIADMSAALARSALAAAKIVSIPTLYPSGGEKQLIEILIGRQIPHGQLAFDIGLLCQNVGTCVAIARALERGEALTSRIVTVTGDNLERPGNWETRLGTPVSHLLALAGGLRAQAGTRLVMGGPMMGFALSGERVPIVKASNCILVMQDETVAHGQDAHAECIRCGKCTEVCPARLLPQQLYWHARAQAWDKTREFHLFDCIECGCCSAVCPSGIPLVQYYRAAKSEIRGAQKAQFKSDRARARFENREKRLLLKKQQDEERRQRKREALQRKRAEGAADTTPDPVQAALDRVKARKKAEQEEAE